MKALVTGGGGFLGRYIVEQLLIRGDDVRVYTRGDYPELAAAGAEIFRGDLQDLGTVQKACKGMDVVLHVAARAGFWGGWKAYFGPNVTGTQNIIHACKTNGVPKLVYTSSPSVVFNNQPQEGVDESTPYPAEYENNYSHTKALGEQAVIQANSPELATCSLRPHLIFGPRDTQIFPRLIERARAGRVPQVGDGTNKVDLTYVEDAAYAHLLAADALSPDSPTAGKCYFISQNEPVVLWPWIGQLLDKLGIRPIKLKVSLGIARTAGGLMEAAWKGLKLQGEPVLTRFLASELAMSHFYDQTNAQRDLGYFPKHNMDEALEKTISYFIEEA
ncbi:MAG: NAD-dependent epimerase/dehydratase family protein [Anaerolineales bacterium]|nr:NAD-dependent epimerase/dehydratase family protein [Anaerolineales bacterium]